MPKATKQKSGRGRKRAKLLVYPSGHTALELYVACERKAKRTKKKKNHRDCEEATDPLSEATLDAGLHLPLVQMMGIFQCCFPVDEYKQVASPRHCTSL